MLIQRVLSAMFLIPIVLGAAYAGGFYFATVVAIASLLAGFEFYHMMRNSYEPSYVAGLSLISALLLDACYPGHGIWRWSITAVLMLLMVRQVFRADTRGFLSNWALTLAGALYVGGLAWHIISLRNLSQGFEWILLTCVVTWACDTAAYFAGNWCGQHAFFAHISPHKTWEGAVAGWLAGLLSTLVTAYPLRLGLWRSIALGVLLVLGVTFGDLAESLLKRQVGVKDSSNLIPGHGGMLDRIDSLLFAGVIVYYFAVWVVHVESFSGA